MADSNANAHLLPWASWLVENRYTPLGLAPKVLEQVKILRREGISREVVEWGLEQVWEMAEANSKRFRRPIVEYLAQSVLQHHLLNYCRGLVASA